MKARHELRHDAAIVRAKCVPEQPLLVTCSVDQAVKVWDQRNGECVRTLLGHGNQVLDVDVLTRPGSAGPVLASSSDDHTCRIFELA